MRIRTGRPEHAAACAWVMLPRWSGPALLLTVVCAVVGVVLATRGDVPAAALAGVPAQRDQSSAAVWHATATPGSPILAGTSLPSAGSAQLDNPRKPPRAGVSFLASDGIPTTALDAYRRAARRSVTRDPHCHLPWPLLAAIGRIESDHGRFAGAVLRTDGTSSTKVIGIALNGVGTALIRDTDRGLLDGDSVFDRAVGPMQFIPSTWVHYAVDGNGDHRADPFNVYDAAAAAAHYLCVAGGNLATSAGQIRAVLAYNHSSAYLAAVLNLESTYADGVRGVTVPTPPTVAPPRTLPRIRPVDPGRPRALPPRHTKPKPSRPPHPPSTRASDPATPTSSVPPSPPACPTPTADPTTSSTTSAASSPPTDVTSATGSAPPSDTPTAPSSSGASSPAPSTSGCGADGSLP
jgi:membrane-bound lytic murein transglycosylase B